ncbi:hypothetical protein ACFY05_27645 [Microtetraspora fusca]|uniref:Uncharacterized protein n=1 Tax=Microtetraspora fusca TaxID=1997 RepID=A0ABW6VBA6_MICFU
MTRPAVIGTCGPVRAAARPSSGEAIIAIGSGATPVRSALR